MLTCLLRQDSEYGCCDDFVTAARTDTLDDCPLDCVNSSYGCCPDGKTTSRGPGMAGCPRQETTAIESTTPLVTTIVSTEANSCASTEFECCPDGRTPASVSFCSFLALDLDSVCVTKQYGITKFATMQTGPSFPRLRRSVASA